MFVPFVYNIAAAHHLTQRDQAVVMHTAAAAAAAVAAAEMTVTAVTVTATVQHQPLGVLQVTAIIAYTCVACSFVAGADSISRAYCCVPISLMCLQSKIACMEHTQWCYDLCPSYHCIKHMSLTQILSYALLLLLC
jgi:hypothetical protein